jgi:hypothetical protein
MHTPPAQLPTPPTGTWQKRLLAEIPLTGPLSATGVQVALENVIPGGEAVHETPTLVDGLLKLLHLDGVTSLTTGTSTLHALPPQHERLDVQVAVGGVHPHEQLRSPSASIAAWL